jgi:hypothetical protein
MVLLLISMLLIFGAPDIPPRRSDDIAAEFQAVGTTGKSFTTLSGKV